MVRRVKARMAKELTSLRIKTVMGRRMKMPVMLRMQTATVRRLQKNMKIAETYEHIATVLGNAGIEDADTEARIILRESAGLSSTDIHMRPAAELDEDVSTQITDIINRRLMREPLQYIYGRWDFMGLVFSVKPGVLIPRPDTEILVETALSELHDGMKILDLCTGTGCILISLLKYSNDCEGIGVDISPEALELAKQNAAEILGEDGLGSEASGAGSGQSGLEFEASGAGYAFLQGDLYDALARGDEDYSLSSDASASPTSACSNASTAST